MAPEEILEIFFVECEESLVAAETGLAACKSGAADDDTINAIFRAVHSIKGGAGAFGFAALQAYTHAFETLLSDVRDGTLPFSEALVELALRALDVLSDHVNAAREGGAAPADADLIAEMRAAQGLGSADEAPVPVADEPGETASSSSQDDGLGLDFDSMLDSITSVLVPAEAPLLQTLRLRFHAGAMKNGNEPLLMLRELVSAGAACIACDVSQVPTLDLFDPAQGYFGYVLSGPDSLDERTVRDLLDFIGDDFDVAFGEEAPMPPLRLSPERESVAPAKATTEPPAPAPGEADRPPPAAPAAATAGNAPAQSIRIDLSKLDRLIDTVGELVIAQAMMAQRLETAGLAGVEEIALLEGLTREIQESAMSIRAQPIGSVFSRVPRILRELASSTGKHVRLELAGETTELDKTVIERLGEPMTHLIRNAVDHGIEGPDERLAAGKNPEGTLTLSAEQRSGRILIRISDDGKGIDRVRVFAKAVEKGLILGDAQLSDEEIDQLIFAPGFSTAQTVSNVSGRGVGMDVVRQNVKDLGGRITIESEQGKGTTFILTLPLTLAISDGMIVNVGGQTLVVPLANVVESLRPGPGEVQGMGASRQMLNVRGQFIPIVPLRSAIGEDTGCEAPTDGVLVVVDTQSAGQAALLVDAISDQRQFVIKSLDTNYRSVNGVAGATILGDGRVALIVDVDGLVASNLGHSTRLAA